MFKSIVPGKLLRKKLKQMRNVLIADSVDHLLQEGFQEMGFTVNYSPNISFSEVLERAPELEGIVINTKTPANKAFLDKAGRLKWIGRLGSGLDIVDLEEAKKRKIEVINSPEGNANAVAEHILGMLLTMLRNICKANLEVKNGNWIREENRGMELGSKTVGIVGFGNTGSAFARLLDGFGCKLLCYDKYKQHFATSYRFAEEVPYLDELLIKSDVISLHLPLSKETKGMADRNFFKKCKKNCVFINSSRGQIVKTAALIDALIDGSLSGACLDVLENEKLNTLTIEEEIAFKKLTRMNNVILTPHIAGWTVESKVKIAQILLGKIKSFYQGK